MREIAFIEDVLREAGALVCERFDNQTDMDVSSKRDANDLLTEVDLAVQDCIVERIRKAYPGDVVVAEERGLDSMPDNDARCWVIDPIDGTQNFVRSLFPTFGISVAFAVGGRPVAGGIMLPIGNDLFLAERGGGTFRNGVRQRVSDVSELSVARIEVDFSMPPVRDETLARADTILRTVGQIRCNSSTVVALCAIVSGDMDGFVEVALWPWDYAAGQVLVEEAGGRASRMDGTDLRLFDGRGGVLMSNGRLHEELVRSIK